MLMDRGSPVPSHVSWDDSTTSSMDMDMDDSGMSMSLDDSGMDMTSAWSAHASRDGPRDDSGDDPTLDDEAAIDADDSRTVEMDLTMGMPAARAPPSPAASDATATMEFTAVHAPLPDADESLDTTRESRADDSAMEMTAMWGRSAESAAAASGPAWPAASTQVRSPSPPPPPTSPSPSLRRTSASRSMSTPSMTSATPPPAALGSAPRRAPTPSALSVVRSPAAAEAAATPSPSPPGTPRRSTLTSPFRPRPSTPGTPGTPGTPSRFRQSLRGGVPSPEYVHSPPGRAVTTPPPPRSERAARSARMVSPVAARLSESHAPVWPRSPFIHSLIKQRGVRLSLTPAPASPLSDMDDSDAEASFHMRLADFLNVVGLQFHEDMTASRTRPSRPLDEPRDVGAVQHAKLASAAAPMLQALRGACAELKQHVDDGRERLRAMEDDFYTRPPAFVQEWGQLDDDDMRRSMKGQLNVHKQAARAAAMHDYYGWRTDMEFDDELVAQLEQCRDALRRDLEHTTARHAQWHELLPALRARHAELLQRVSDARTRQQQIQECDPDELKALRASVDEQEQVLQTMRAQHRDLADQLARVRARAEDTAKKREQMEDAIRVARATTDQIQGCSPGEAVRLERHVRHLEGLLAWSLTNKTSTLLQLTLAQAWQVAIECDSRKHTVKRVVVSPAASDAAPWMRTAVAAVRAVLAAELPADMPEVLRTIAQVWHRCQRAHAQLRHLQAYVPLTEAPSQDSDTAWDARASILLARHAAKVEVHVRLALAEPAPLTPESVEARVLYGHVEYVCRLTQHPRPDPARPPRLVQGAPCARRSRACRSPRPGHDGRLGLHLPFFLLFFSAPWTCLARSPRAARGSTASALRRTYPCSRTRAARTTRRPTAMRPRPRAPPPRCRRSSTFSARTRTSAPPRARRPLRRQAPTHSTAHRPQRR